MRMMTGQLFMECTGMLAANTRAGSIPVQQLLSLAVITTRGIGTPMCRLFLDTGSHN